MLKTKVFLFLLIVTTSYGCQTQQSNNQESSNELLADPSVQFFQDLEFLESPSSRILTNQQEKNTLKDLEQNPLKLPEIRPLEVEGDIELSSTSDINSLNDSIYKRFVQEGYSGVINFSEIDSNTAIRLFCEEGRFDIITVSRPMSDSERETCQSNSRQPLDLPIAKDAFVFVVNRQDIFLKNIRLEKLKDFFKLEKWSDVNSDWPDEPIERFLIIPPTLLFERFPEFFWSKQEEPILNPLNTNYYKFYNPLSQDLSVTRYGLGYISYPAYLLNSKYLRVVPIEGHVANAQTVQDGVYPLSYSIYLYGDLNQLQQKPQVSSFINYYLTHVNEEIEQVGYFPLSEKELNNSKSNWGQWFRRMRSYSYSN